MFSRQHMFCSFWSFIKCFCTSCCSAMQNIKCSVFLFLWKLFFCSLCAFCTTEAFQNFSSRCFDIHNGTGFLFNTSSNAKIVSHHLIMNLSRMIVGNIWTLISSSNCVGGINLNHCYLRIFHPIAIMQLHNGLKRSSPSSKSLPEFFLIGNHSMQGWTATARHRVKRKRKAKRWKHTGNLFRKNLQLIGIC